MITTVPTTPIAGQKPGTSGLRKKVPEFQARHYVSSSAATGAISTAR
jgi:phosphoglucomutase